MGPGLSGGADGDAGSQALSLRSPERAGKEGLVAGAAGGLLALTDVTLTLIGCGSRELGPRMW